MVRVEGGLKRWAAASGWPGAGVRPAWVRGGGGRGGGMVRDAVLVLSGALCGVNRRWCGRCEGWAVLWPEGLARRGCGRERPLGWPGLGGAVVVQQLR